MGILAIQKSRTGMTAACIALLLGTMQGAESVFSDDDSIYVVKTVDERFSAARSHQLDFPTGGHSALTAEDSGGAGQHVGIEQQAELTGWTALGVASVRLRVDSYAENADERPAGPGHGNNSLRTIPGLLTPSVPITLHSAMRPVSATVAENSDDDGRESTTVVNAAERVAVGDDSIAEAGKAANSAQVSLQVLSDLEAQIDASNLSDEERSIVQQHCRRVREYLERSAQALDKSRVLRAETDSAPKLIESLRQALSEPVAPPQEPSSTADVEALESSVRDLRRQFDEAKAVVAKFVEDANRRKRRQTELPSRIADFAEKVAESESVLAAPEIEGEHALVSQARRLEQQAHADLLASQQELLNEQREHDEAQTELFPLMRDQAERARSTIEATLKLTESRLTDARRVETERQAAEAKVKLRQTHPALRSIAEKNAELAEKRSSLQLVVEQTDRKLQSIADLLEELDSEFESFRSKEERAGLTTAVGLLLRNSRAHLPSTDRYRGMRDDTEEQIERLQAEQMALEDERANVADVEAEVAAIVDQLESPAAGENSDFEGMAYSLLSDRRQYLDELVADYDTCLTNLAELDVRAKKLTSTVVELRQYIDERVLWIRSSSPLDWSTIQRAGGQARSFASSAELQAMASVLRQDARLHQRLYISMGTFLFVLLGIGIGFGPASRLLPAKNSDGDTSWRTVVLRSVSVAANVLLLPSTAWLIGWRLQHADGTNLWATSVGVSLTTVAIPWCVVRVMRSTCRRPVLSSLFDWDGECRRRTDRSLRPLSFLAMPAVFVLVFADTYRNGAWSESLGRMAFLAGTSGLFWTLLLVVSGNRRTIRSRFSSMQSSWGGLFGRAVNVLTVVAPLALGALSVAGYLYTAEHLMLRLVYTLGLGLVLLGLYSLATSQRWLLRTHKLIDEGEDAQSHPVSAPSTPALEQAVDQNRWKMAAQLQRLVRIAACVLFLAGSWSIWAEVLPAFQIVSRIELWPTTIQVSEVVDLGEGLTEARMVSRPGYVTLGNLFMAAATILLTMTASQNLPGLMELVVLRKLNLDRGGRHAVTTLSRYVIVVIGMIITCRLIGIGWSSVQWLAAALTVGLGFGLQEIFANFVSGLIILFERPVRIGDVVSIDNVTGEVSQIRIRATTIRDRDQKEYIVPNKEFVTGRLLNWTLSDRVNRVVINVGVAYGTDTDRARELMLNVARQHPRVLSEPEPRATFENFGDSSLDLVLRCFLADLENRFETISELHTEINRAFDQEDIVIPFPQMDLHMPSTRGSVFIGDPVVDGSSQRAA